MAWTGAGVAQIDNGGERMSVTDKMLAVLAWEPTLRYQMLDRMKADCEYFFGGGNRIEKYLWAGSVADQIDYMKAIWWSFPDSERPEWLTLADIEDYERRMEG